MFCHALVFRYKYESMSRKVLPIAQIQLHTYHNIQIQKVKGTPRSESNLCYCSV